ncbi:MAG: cobalamin-independent methionine synthase II family protein [Brevundimonas sp.]|jgi:5-methyltetrahydropteroyltriglutamate--homocysteine methyltransferase|uniref:cobalamin-independent methionine synthase II family protein n=1 Tax=Brevundimonas sp. TaxID=1871086 RepID=UPI0022C1F159|nr:cobalamin-independent methionine synthase II family protein [Brevundimonas sp.]MCZ8086742.1 cobalamin-independent methionine synthase II family protein [Brevundimonas sp.]MCZ8194159.1 cobalamin-independent methionine synthase II family protein [Brevundimonas sp.]
MKTSIDRILTTHVGSLPRPAAVARGLFARESEDAEFDSDAFETVVFDAVVETVRRQVETGLDVVSDGEMSKISYATYVKDRLDGFGGDSPRRAPQDLEQFPNFLARQASGGGTPTYRRPMCVGPIAVKDDGPLNADISNMVAATGNARPVEAFLNSASPGVIALFQPNGHYPTQDAYLEALSEAMRSEYEAIVDAGFVLQIDSPDLGVGRHMMFKDLPESDYVRACEGHLEALNSALSNVPPDRVRMHVCWGNYEGPHHCDAPFETVFGLARRAKVGAILFEAANPRHAHEWTWFEENELPGDLIIIPGVIDSTTNFIEHPELVAQRIERYANLVGRERVVAGADCGFGTFAGFGPVDPDIAWAKLGALVEGAAIASDRLWKVR